MRYVPDIAGPDLDAHIVHNPEWELLVRANTMSEVRHYGHRMMNIPGFQKRTKGKGILYGVLDSGVPRHEDLKVNREWSVYDRYKSDVCGHATHVGGIIAGIENGKGVIGVAPEARVNYYTVLDAEGSGSIRSIVRGINRAVEDGVDIINMSLGIPSGYQTIKELKAACDKAAARDVIIFAAAGNEYGPIGQPGCYPSVVCVGAVNWKGRKADFSNFGREIDFACGGVEIFSTFPNDEYLGQPGYINNSYCKLSGTSMATPLLAGVYGLLLNYERDQRNKLHFRWCLKDAMYQMRQISFDVGPRGWDSWYGHGIPVLSNRLVKRRRRRRRRRFVRWLRRCRKRIFRT